MPGLGPNAYKDRVVGNGRVRFVSDSSEHSPRSSSDGITCAVAFNFPLSK